jgi:NAD(P)-dependent dehydrogenase (short-subunit alcohol dehydrogenase family)
VNDVTVGVLTGKAAIVTGAAQGIGRGIATALAKEGCDTILVDLQQDAVRQTANEIEALGLRCIPIAGSVGDQDVVDAATKAAADELGRLDVLVNNAQALRPGIRIEDYTDADFELCLSSGLWGAFRFMRAGYPLLSRQGGSIVNIVSSAGTHGLAGFAGYAAAKEGMRGLTKVAALEWGPAGIRVNAICPQAPTPETVAYLEANPERRQEKAARRPIQREGDPEADAGRTVVFLAGPDSGFITGTTIMVNGGLTIMP